MNRLRMVLAAQLLFFTVWGGWLLSSRNTASPEFYLETVPVDPRDLLSGTFVALTYGISAPEPCRDIIGGRTAAMLYVELRDEGRTAAAETGPVKPLGVTGCAETPGEGQWAKASVYNDGSGPLRATYGIERFYLNENDPRKDARSGSVIAKVKLGRAHQLILLDLVKKL